MRKTKATPNVERLEPGRLRPEGGRRSSLQRLAERAFAWIAAAAVLVAPAVGRAQTPTPDLADFRAIYEELINTNTTLSSGDCTKAAGQLAARLRKAGFPDGDLHIFQAPGHAKEGGLVAVLPGIDRTQKGLLLIAHLDVVEARREEWTRDPFKLVEEGGYFYARGAIDDKAMAAIWVDTLARFRREGLRPARDVKLALTWVRRRRKPSMAFST